MDQSLEELLTSNLKKSRSNYQQIVATSNALYVLWSREDDPERRHLVHEQDQLRRVVARKSCLLKICEYLRITFQVTASLSYTFEDLWSVMNRFKYACHVLCTYDSPVQSHRSQTIDLIMCCNLRVTSETIAS